MLLFRRVGGAFRGIEAREWALLTLETIGVVAGILIAFELNEWAASRNEAKRHDRLMERLFEEAENDVVYLRDMRNLLVGFRERESAFAISLSRDQCPSEKQFQALLGINRYPAMIVPTNVYQELMGAGGLSSIERRDVRDSIALFHTNLNWNQKQVEFFRDGRVEPISDDDDRTRIRFDPSSDEPEVVSFDRSALCKDRVFKNKVATATRNHRVFISYFEEALKDAINMCVIIGDSIGKTCEPRFGGPLTGEDAKFAAETLANIRKKEAAN